MDFQGKLVHLRPLTVEDAQITLRWRLSPHARLMQSGAQTVEKQLEWIQNSTKLGDLNFIMEYQDEPVGMIALLDYNEKNRNIQMGRLLIGEPEKVAQAPVVFETELILCDYIFDTLKLHKLYGEVLEENFGMLRTRLYLGYKKDGLLRDHYNYGGTYKNAIAMSLLEEEYRQTCRPKLIQLVDLLSSTCK